ncbi:MAG: sporulation protein YunB [Ruminococcus sp.]|nr:sporulation protein YunB [Ruminococcus sp.]
MRHHKKMYFRLSRTVFICSAVAVFTAILFISVKTDRALKPVARLQAEHFAEMHTNQIIQSTVSDYLDKNRYTYSDFAFVLYDENEKCVSVESSPYTINKVQSDLTLAVNKRLEKSGNKSEKIPVGSLTDSFLLAGKGPELKIRVCPAGSASVKLKSDFDSSGINQTRHRISAEITVNISSSFPLYTFRKTVQFEFLLAENIIIGDVPDYTNF